MGRPQNSRVEDVEEKRNYHCRHDGKKPLGCAECMVQSMSRIIYVLDDTYMYYIKEQIIDARYVVLLASTVQRFFSSNVRM